MGVFVYADESGHSGKNLFDPRSSTFFQGAIVSVGDTDPILKPIIDKYCKQFDVPRLHANEYPETTVAEIGNELLDALDGITWQFFNCKIEKPYLASAKFVDLFFDSSDNPAIPATWYNLEVFRHALCLTIDFLFTHNEAELFWTLYLADDIAGMINLIETLLSRVKQIGDERVKDIVAGGLMYIINQPENFKLTCTKGKSAHKVHTPNMIAFMSLIAGTQEFCNQNKSSVKQFIHDQSDEFKGVMRNLHHTYGDSFFSEDEFGGPVQLIKSDFNLGDFSIKASKDHPSLQAIDILLWLFQRELKTGEGKAVFNRLKDITSSHVISRDMSKLILEARRYQAFNTPITEEQIKLGNQFGNELEKRRQEVLKTIK